ncbi:MAG: hypothetical protein SGJ01_12480 [Gemmatimonadota bacterium]|nr:hypothetical protein [Gemmatimonadota bacterium]MDZ4864249.1 hypothetical protein [Gemmatimonadota bacterium]
MIRLARFCVALTLVMVACPGVRLLAQGITPEQQAAAAVLPLPATMRSGAAVMTIARDGTLRPLRAGTNGMICLADTPADSLFDVRCYHQSFMPLVTRRRVLARLGMADADVTRQIDTEVRDGTLKLPASPTAGYRILGPIGGYDAVTNTATDAIDRWQSLHIPYATAAELGVSEESVGIEPYAMASGSWWAHVMILELPLRY